MPDTCSAKPRPLLSKALKCVISTPDDTSNVVLRNLLPYTVGSQDRPLCGDYPEHEIHPTVQGASAPETVALSLSLTCRPHSVLFAPSA